MSPDKDRGQFSSHLDVQQERLKIFIEKVFWNIQLPNLATKSPLGG